MKSPGFSIESAEAALLGGMRPTLSEWMDLDEGSRQALTDAGSGLLRSSLMTVCAALRGPAEADAIFGVLRREEDRIEEGLHEAAAKAAADPSWRR
jgi:hypothetical protein